MPRLTSKDDFSNRGTARRLILFAVGTLIVCALILGGRDAPSWYFALALPVAVGLVGALAFLTNDRDYMPPAEAGQTTAERTAAAKRDQLAPTILDIVEASLPILRGGLGKTSATALVEMLTDKLDFDAIAITDTEHVLAFQGAESEHHQAGDHIATDATRTALREQQVTLARSRNEIGCSHPGCRLEGGLIAPLVVCGSAVGAIKFYRTDSDSIGPDDSTLVEGLSRLLSSQLELQEVEVQRQLADEAQVRALKAQIHPHFIFNVLNTISSACVVDPQVARTVVLRLSSLLRRTFRIRTEFITLQEELALVREYLEIESVRFPDMISYREEVDSETVRCLVPVLSLQPLVENCVIHGLQDSHIRILLRAGLDGDALRLEVEDNGTGVDESQLDSLISDDATTSQGVGIRNTARRLRVLTRGKGRVAVENRSPGLRVTIELPIMRPESDTHAGRRYAHADGPRG